MRLICDVTGRRMMGFLQVLLSFTLGFALFVPGAHAQAQQAGQNSAEQKPGSEPYQTLYLTNLTQPSDANEIMTALRNMLPRAKLYYVDAENAISLRGSQDDLLLAQRMLSDLDRPRRLYRLTYTITQTDNGKRIGSQHYSLIVLSGGKAVLRQGSRVPIVTGGVNGGTASQNFQVQYLDVGLNIEAHLDGERLNSKVEQSSLAVEKSGLGVQDPVIHQTVLEGTMSLVEGKPLVLGALDIPGSTQHREIEVVSELVR